MDDDNPTSNNPVTFKLCEAYRETVNEKINGLKRTIYISASAMTTVIIVVQFILYLVK